MHSARARNGQKAWMLLVALLLLAAAYPAGAQPYDVPPTWGGDFWSRPRVTGDWGGLRDALGKNGIVFDVDLLLTPQDVMTGGRSTGAIFWGNADYTLNVDMGKAGLWRGGFLAISADSGFGGGGVLRNPGTIVPVNTAALLPGPNDQTTALMGLQFTQFLNTKFGLFLGKINTLESSGEFTGDYRTQFLNYAFVSPVTLEQEPNSAFGGGVTFLPREDVLLSVMALDPDGTPTSNDLGKAFSDGVMVVGNGELTIKPFGLVGHQNVGFSWSNKDRFSLTQDPSNIARLLLNERFPRLSNPGPLLSDILQRTSPALLVPAQPAARKNSTWSVSYGFDQYFWQPPDDPNHGIGVFFAFGASDGNPNPIQYAFVAGIGGKGVLPGRADDSFGLGFARTQFSSDFVPFLRQSLSLGLEHEDAIEMYYSAAITQWLTTTADLQIINSGLNKAINSSGQLANINTTAVAGVRLRVRF
jgi:porin